MGKAVLAKDAVEWQWYEDEVYGRMRCVKEDPHYFLVQNAFGELRLVCPSRGLAVEHLEGCTGWDWVKPKPEPKYRPFNGPLEFFKHRDRWLAPRNWRGPHRGTDHSRRRVLSYGGGGVSVRCRDGVKLVLWADLVHEYEFEDGRPCGVLVQE